MFTPMFHGQNRRNILIPNVANGYLYNWFAVSDAKNIAPTNCHVPTDAEWQTLIDYLGGDAVAGGKLKATTIWNSPNTGATNSSGFTALPSGYRSYSNGAFSNVGSHGYWWSSTEFAASAAFSRQLFYNFDDTYHGNVDKLYGESVRCVCDISASTITDIDGNIYNTVLIGSQRWLVQNLKVTKYRDGTVIPNVTDNTAWTALTTGARCVYDNNENNA